MRGCRDQFEGQVEWYCDRHDPARKPVLSDHEIVSRPGVLTSTQKALLFGFPVEVNEQLTPYAARVCAANAPFPKYLPKAPIKPRTLFDILLDDD
jgi:hypothetical protein